MRKRTDQSGVARGRSAGRLLGLAVAATAYACGSDGGEERPANAPAPEAMAAPGAMAMLGGPASGPSTATPEGAATSGGAATSATPEAPATPALMAAAEAASAAIAPDSDLLLDELTDMDGRFAAGNVVGEWFTYSDGTASIVPPDHTGLGTVAGEAHVEGSGFSLWGAGLSAYFGSVDLSAFDGVRLRARGAGVIVIELATPATSPAAEGGTCVGDGCFGHFATSITLGDAYQDFDIAFASLVQPTWAQPAALALDGVISLNLVAKVAGTPADLDLWIDRLALHASP